MLLVSVLWQHLFMLVSFERFVFRPKKKKWKNEFVTPLLTELIKCKLATVTGEKKTIRYTGERSKRVSTLFTIPTSFTIAPPPQKFLWKLFVSFFRQKEKN